jgi:hypothetical protein
MRKKFLSFFMIVCAVMATAIVHRAITRMDGDGTAQAAFSAMGAPVGEMRTENRKSLAKDISLHPDRLMNIRGQDVKTVLREPELVRAESPTTIWQYRTDSCVLDIYFTGNADPLLSPVSFYEIRARGKNASDADVSATCVRELARKSGRPRMVDVSTLYKR